MKKHFIALLVSQTVLLSVFSLPVFAHIDISVPDVNSLIASDPNAILIDVRDLSEYCGPTGHVAGALLYPWNSQIIQNSFHDLLKSDTIIIICRSGGRSNDAANLLDSQGYLHVYDMINGMNDWHGVYSYQTVDCIDTDSDGLNDDLDNCPTIYNPRQTDSDGDGIGNVCDDLCPYLDDLSFVNFADYAILAQNWQQQASNIIGDLNHDDIVDINDLPIFSYYWLTDCN
ncbi:MAG: rhodanese-like domain-containing protein [Planctomycetes bacterium]|nr:rhodanese-like domain-containing protein [Planctomycetota bacterium]